MKDAKRIVARSLNLDKAMTRIKKSRKYNKARVEEDTIKKMGRNEYKKMKAAEKLQESDRRESQSTDKVIHGLNMQIEQTKPGSKAEEDLVKRRNRLSRAFGRSSMKVGK